MKGLDIRFAPVFILLVVAALPAGAKEDEPAPAEPLKAEAVDEAIRKGVEFLKGEQSRDGSFDRDPGSTGLAVCALAHSGVERGDRSLDAALRWLLANQGRPDTYGASLAVMALATVDRLTFAKRIRLLARLIADGQCENGQWSYALRAGRSSGDNSNTQFALLALWYARGAGAKTDGKVFERSRAFFLESQNEDGGWGYSAKERTKSYGSMVATGLAALAICRAGEEARALADAKNLDGEAVGKAKAWLSEHLAVDANPLATFKLRGGMRGVRKEITDSYWRFYWLWSLERAATLAKVEKLGGKDWYAEGARALLAEQREDGSWVGSESALFATSFALLFLTRSTRRAVATEPPLPKGTTTPLPR